MATNTLSDYSEAIIIPGNIPEHMEAHYIALKRAKEVIHILSLSALHVKTREYTISHGTHEKMILPEEDLNLIEDFIKTYNRLPDSEPRYREPKISERGSSFEIYLKSNPPLSKRKQAVIDFRNDLQKLGR